MYISYLRQNNVLLEVLGNVLVEALGLQPNAGEQSSLVAASEHSARDFQHAKRAELTGKHHRKALSPPSFPCPTASRPRSLPRR